MPWGWFGGYQPAWLIIFFVDAAPNDSFFFSFARISIPFAFKIAKSRCREHISLACHCRRRRRRRWLIVSLQGQASICLWGARATPRPRGPLPASCSKNERRREGAPAFIYNVCLPTTERPNNNKLMDGCARRGRNKRRNCLETRIKTTNKWRKTNKKLDFRRRGDG